jgi:hypothetical protein
VTGLTVRERRSHEIVERVVARWSVAAPFLVVGAASVIAGGLVAAVTRPTGFEMGSWLAAYLVLVGGVAQIALGVGQAALAQLSPPSATVRAEVVSWNLGLGATMIGSLASLPVVTSLGAVATIAALVLFLRGVRGRATEARRWRLLYGGVILVVLVSTPIGLALAWARHG